MTQYKYLKFEKLIRDKNPKVHVKDGGYCEFYFLPKDELIKHLKMKLVEEAQEVLDAGNPEEVIDELGDVVEVMKSLIRAAKIRKFKIWKARMKKLKYRGGFKKGVYCKYVKYPVDITKKWMWKYPDITNQFVKNDK